MYWIAPSASLPLPVTEPLHTKLAKVVEVFQCLRKRGASRTAHHNAAAPCDGRASVSITTIGCRGQAHTELLLNEQCHHHPRHCLSDPESAIYKAAFVPFVSPQLAAAPLLYFSTEIEWEKQTRELHIRSKHVD